MKSIRTFVALFVLVWPAFANSQVSPLVGDWTIVTTGFQSLSGGTTYIIMSIEENDGELEAFIYNGPAPLRVNGNEFELDLDWKSGFDVEYLSTFKGVLNDDGSLEGELDHNGASNFLGRQLRNGNFTGARSEPRPEIEGLAPDPVDLSGIWNRAVGLGAANKIKFAMTDEGQAIFDQYLEMDNANTRCASPGLVFASGLPYPMEILPTENYIVIVYGADYARRVYLDDREFPDDAVRSSLGFSKGEWKGETLVVTTTMLNPAFISSRGQPVSADAYTVEHFYFDNKGYLHADMVVHDPKNYTRAPIRRRVYDRNFSPTVVTKVDCDPYTFFRALYLGGELEEFWNRAIFRR